MIPPAKTDTPDRIPTIVIAKSLIFIGLTPRDFVRISPSMIAKNLLAIEIDIAIQNEKVIKR